MDIGRAMTESRIIDKTYLIIVLFYQMRWWSSVRSPRRRAFRRRMLNARGKARALRPPLLPAVSGLQTLFPFGPLKPCQFAICFSEGFMLTEETED